MKETGRKPVTMAALREENERLRACLDEAEQLIGAIGKGEVDALIVSGPHGDQVFSLTGVERAYRLIVETMNEAALTVDQDGTILFCNRRFCELMKRPINEAIGRKISAFVAPPQRPPLLQLLADVQAKPVQRPLTLRAADGAPVSVQIAASLLLSDNQTSTCLVLSDLTDLEASAASIRVLREQRQTLEERTAELEQASAGLRREIAERKRMEKELRRAKDAAVAANNTKSQFLANMSHELRTPMTGVLGMLQITLDGDLDAEQRERIKLAHKSAHSLLGIINDILDLSRVESGKLAVENIPFRLRACLDDTCEILSSTARHKGLDLVCSVADDVPENLMGDRMRLAQVLVNLMGNAIKFTEKGKVEVRVEVSGKEIKGKKLITFSVTDTGIGVPDAMKERIFHSFSQGDASHSRRYGGTGLGLSISRKILELMGGTISLESREGSGSTFSFSVPFEIDKREVEALPATGGDKTRQSSPAAIEQEKPRILVAEDDPVTRNIFGYLLKLSGFEYDFAADGAQAVEMWESGRYGLIVMDGQMPAMDGFEATRIIRGREKDNGGHIPIVAVTAHAFKEDENRCLEAGMDAYVPKPIEFKELIRKILECLENRKETVNGQTE